MEREGAPCSPDCVPALDIVFRAEMRSVNELESAHVGTNIVSVLDERGNAVNLFRAASWDLVPGTRSIRRAIKLTDFRTEGYQAMGSTVDMDDG
jgi:hypothetical protein